MAIKAIWSESSLAEFKMILKDEIARYGLPHDFGPAVSFAGKTLPCIYPTILSPAYALSTNQNYFFTHGDKDQRDLTHHFDFFIKFSKLKNIKAQFWLSIDSEILLFND